MPPGIAPENDTERHALTTPSQWVVRFSAAIPPRGLVLDVAAGRGRHAAWLRAQGYRVVAVDRDAEALSQCDADEKIVADLEAAAWPFPNRSFDGVVVTNYLHRPLFPLLLAALSDGGVLIYETFAAGNAAFGRPANPDFLLRPGELLAHCATLQIVAYEDGVVAEPRPAAIQRICAVRAAPDDASMRKAL